MSFQETPRATGRCEYEDFERSSFFRAVGVDARGPPHSCRLTPSVCGVVMVCMCGCACAGRSAVCCDARMLALRRSLWGYCPRSRGASTVPRLDRQPSVLAVGRALRSLLLSATVAAPRSPCCLLLCLCLLVCVTVLVSVCPGVGVNISETCKC